MRAIVTARICRRAFSMIFVLLTGASARAATYVVDQDGSGDFTSIQVAIEASAHGDVIEVHPGTYNESLFYGGRRITVRSTEGPEVTILDGEGTHTLARFIFAEPRSAVLEGFTLQNGRGTPQTVAGPTGVAPDLSEHPLAGTDPRVDELRATATDGGGTAGGAILCAPGHPTLRNLVFRGNFANLGGALYAYGSVPFVEHCHFMDNIAGRGGAITAVFSAMLIHESEFHENSAVYGGALHFEDCPVELHMSVIHGHIAKQGGALYAAGSGGAEAMVHHTVFSHNGASWGQAISSFDHPMLIRNNVFFENFLKPYEAGTVQFVGEYGGGSVFQNIFFGEALGGHIGCNDSPLDVYCNDFFPGPLPDCAPSSNNFSANPLFCSPDEGDFSVRADSPCLPGRVPNGCGFVGIHLEPGCPSPHIDLRSIMEEYQERVRATRPQ